MSTDLVSPSLETDVQAQCKNCETELHGHFCAHCGQTDRPLDPTMHDLLHELTHELLHLDGKIFLTFKMLVFHPGQLTAEFLSGRRARFIGPVRLYLTMSLLFFLLMAHDPTEKHSGKAEVKQADQGEQYTDKDDPVQVAKNKDDAGITINIGDDDSGKSEKHSWLRQYLHRKISDPEAFKHEMMTNISHAIFLMIPVFALALRMAYYKRHYRYPAYIYFSLHYHAIVFLLFAMGVLASWLHSGLIDTLVFFVVLFAPLMYLHHSMRRVFGGTHLRTALRIAALSAIYLPALLLVLLAAVAAAYIRA
jgi:hypothetical protein